ncbi:hypothetical protein VTL71DRAFT_16351 [Oculimacula yallundae]|uniref:CN hydrolase domain-containing protein n=1 Tax=Oculimacula yallundae TaxID=86028 RepID=A0ABR4CE83_9HELO
MRIACLQFAPQVGDVNNNLNRADAVLSRANPQDLDLLVLPELAFTGYNFRSLQHISPYLEPTTAGITSLWARTTALKYDCAVTAGYPEKVDITPKWPANPEYYNSAVTVNAEGETVANYRKSFLYYTDETWALEGSGFFDGTIAGLGNVAMGICMDLNPYKFEAPWNAWEFSYHVLRKEANLVILSMAWLTREEARSFSRTPKEPDMDTLSYWLARLEPLIRAEGDDEIIVVLANRCGVEGDAVYAGTSAVLGIQNGEVKVYGILGRGERELLVVDTTQPPQAKLISEPTSASSQRRSIGSNHCADQTPSAKASKPVHNSKATRSPASNLSVSIGTPSPRSFSSSPVTPSAMSISVEDMAPPLSPRNPREPNSFFSKPGDADIDLRRGSIVSLKSSTDISEEAGSAHPDSPTLYQHLPSPTSRNASRNHQLNFADPSLISPKLAQEHQATARTFGADNAVATIESPLHSAPAIPDGNKDTFTSRETGLRNTLGSPRPKTMYW